jgi:hypothetical protein
MSALLVLGAFFVSFLIAVFAGGALVGLAGLGLQALRATARTRDVKSAASRFKQEMRPARLQGTLRVETAVPAGTMPALA